MWTIHRHATAIRQDAAAALRCDLKCTGQMREKKRKKKRRSGKIEQALSLEPLIPPIPRVRGAS